MDAEKVNLNFCKFILGVHRKTQNSAVRGELGRYPIALEAMYRAMKYHNRLVMSARNTLLGASIQFHEEENTSYMLKIHLLMKVMNVNINRLADNATLKQGRQNLMTRYSNHWKWQTANQPKMRTYTKFKSNFTMEDYLSIHRANERKALSKFRTSAHNLRTERDRYVTPKVPPENRICTRCNMGCIEDELHFLLDCPLYTNERQALVDNITQSVPNFQNLSKSNQFIYLLLSSDNVIKTTAKYIEKCSKIREEAVN